MQRTLYVCTMIGITQILQSGEDVVSKNVEGKIYIYLLCKHPSLVLYMPVYVSHTSFIFCVMDRVRDSGHVALSILHTCMSHVHSVCVCV